MAEHHPHEKDRPSETSMGSPMPSGYRGQHGGVPEIPEGTYDDWSDHTGEPPASEPHGSQASPRALALTLVAMTFGVLFVIVTLVVYFNTYTAQLKSERQEGWTGVSQTYRTLRRSAEADLNTAEPGWIDSSAGTVRVPLAQAKRRVIEEYGREGLGLDPLQVAPRPAGVQNDPQEAPGGM